LKSSGYLVTNDIKGYAVKAVNVCVCAGLSQNVVDMFGLNVHD